MATRYYFQTGGGGIPAQAPNPDSGWENYNGTVRRRLLHKMQINVKLDAQGVNETTEVPVGTTADYMVAQWISDPIHAQTIRGTFSFVVQGMENPDAGANMTMAIVVRLMSNDCQTVRGTLYSVFGTGSELNAVSDFTRIVNAAAVSSLTAEEGDRIVIEWGVHIANNTTDLAYGSWWAGITDVPDLPLVSGDSSVGNYWCEFSQDIIPSNMPPHLFRHLQVESGMSSSGALQ